MGAINSIRNTSLPPELVDHILYYIEIASSPGVSPTQTFRATALVAQSWLFVSRARLFRSLCIAPCTPWPSALAFILSRPHLAQFVTELHVVYSPYDGYMNGDFAALGVAPVFGLLSSVRITHMRFRSRSKTDEKAARRFLSRVLEFVSRAEDFRLDSGGLQIGSVGFQVSQHNSDGPSADAVLPSVKVGHRPSLVPPLGSPAVRCSGVFLRD